MSMQTEYHQHTASPLGEQYSVDPLRDGISRVELVAVSGSDLDVVNAARVSYGKVSHELNERDQKLIDYLVAHDHTSPLEHNRLSFRVKCPIFVARQWMRHRMNSYNEISYRYVASDLEFYMPQTWRKQDMVNKQSSHGSVEFPEGSAAYEQALAAAVRAYNLLLDNGIAREQARGILPVCTYTEFIFTCNLHSLFHFLKLRAAKEAQQEIQEYAIAMGKMAKVFFPYTCAALAKKVETLDFLLSE